MKMFAVSPGLLGMALAGLAHVPACAQGADPGMMVMELTSLADAASADVQGVAAGKVLFAQCQACHSVDGTDGVGPSLKGVVGRKAGRSSDFRYSRAMMGAPVMWDPKTLDAFIAEPQKVVPGTVMPFAGLPDASQRAALVAYLRTLK